jgi:nitroreductase
MDDFIDFCQHRRSIRNFSPTRVEQDEIIDIIIAGSFAPSIGDLQPWEFVIIQERDTKQSLIELCPENDWMYSAPVLIAVIANYSRTRTYHGEEADSVCRDSCSAAIQNMLLAAQQRELGACWVSQFDSSKIGNVLGVAEGHECIALIALGHPENSELLKKDINPLKEFVFFESYGNTQTDAEVRLRDYGEATRNKLSEYSDSTKRHAVATKEKSVSLAESFKDQLKDWIDRTKRK